MSGHVFSSFRSFGHSTNVCDVRSGLWFFVFPGTTVRKNSPGGFEVSPLILIFVCTFQMSLEGMLRQQCQQLRTQVTANCWDFFVFTLC